MKLQDVKNLEKDDALAIFGLPAREADTARGADPRRRDVTVARQRNEG